jgi:hypothetical protein
VKHIAMWTPAAVALVILFMTGVIMVRVADEARDAILVNLKNTCHNSERFRSTEEVEKECWSEYRRLGGR